MRKLTIAMGSAAFVSLMSVPSFGMFEGGAGEDISPRAPSSRATGIAESELLFDDPLQGVPEIPACLRSKKEETSDGVMEEFWRMNAAVEKLELDLEIVRRLSQEIRRERKEKDSFALARLWSREYIEERFKRIEKELEEEAKRAGKRTPFYRTEILKEFLRISSTINKMKPDVEIVRRLSPGFRSGA